MNKQRAKKLKDMAVLFYQMQPQGVDKKSVEQIYNELKKVHKNKTNEKNGTRPATKTN